MINLVTEYVPIFEDHAKGLDKWKMMWLRFFGGV